MVLNIDFAQTFLDYAGAKAPAEMQGRSFRANLEGHTPQRLAEVDVLPLLDAQRQRPSRARRITAIRTEQWKLIYYYGKPLGMKGAQAARYAPEWELFDMKKDPHEMNNLYRDPKYAHIVKELKRELEALQRQAGDKPVRTEETQ